jgi:hypothetical protein
VIVTKYPYLKLQWIFYFLRRYLLSSITDFYMVHVPHLLLFTEISTFFYFYMVHVPHLLLFTEISTFFYFYMVHVPHLFNFRVCVVFWFCLLFFVCLSLVCYQCIWIFHSLWPAFTIVYLMRGICDRAIWMGID